MTFVPVMHPLLPSAREVGPFLERMDANRHYSNRGQLVRELESSWAAKLGLDPALVVACANATLGLTGAIALSEPTEWLVPDFTFAATAHAVLQAGKRLVLADVDSETWRLVSPGAISTSEAGLVPVIPFGQPFLLTEFDQGASVVIDAAASLGPEPNLWNLPPSWAVVFSLHATKVAPAGEGGLVAFGSAELADKFRSWINFGFSGSRSSARLATNAKMSEIHAAYGLASLSRWSIEKSEWLDSQTKLRNRLPQSDEITLFGSPGPHPYLIARFKNSEVRADAEAQAAADLIGTRRWWQFPLHQMPAFREAATAGSLDSSILLGDTTLGLPMRRGMDDGVIERVVSCFSR